MKAKVARRRMRHAKPAGKSTRGKKHARARTHASRKQATQAVPVEREIIED